MVQPCDTPCREWRGGRSKGYGIKWDKTRQKKTYVHRWVMAQIHGWEAIEGKVVMHVCDNPACYRYDHLRIGTQIDNISDRDTKGRHANTRKSKCPKGHAYSEENTYVDNKGKRHCRTCNRLRMRRTL
jgi:hypothetical protein